MEPEVVPVGDGINGWTLGPRCTEADSISLSFFLQYAPETQAALEKALFSVSDPLSAEYGAHWSQDRVTDLVAQPEAAKALVEWLDQAGALSTAISLHPNRDSLSVELSCPLAESMLETQIHHFSHRSVRRPILRARTGYTLPAALAPRVATVAPLLRLPHVTKPIIVKPNPEPSSEPGSATWETGCGGPTEPLKSCTDMVTPAILTKAYKLGAAPSGEAKGSMAVAEFQGVFWDQPGLDFFTSACHLPNISVTQIGPQLAAECELPILGMELCAEAMLDLEYIKGVGGSVPLTDISELTYSLEKWAQSVSAMASPPLVQSISYGTDEIQSPNTPAFMGAVDAEFMKLGVRGISILVASGDQGVWGRTGDVHWGPHKNRFHPDFPASSRYVTAVGGTDFATANTVGPEKAWVDGGGGFSDTFASPDYQKSAVKAYLAGGTALPNASFYNASGRAYPDVSALGGEQNSYCVAVAPPLMTGVAGTSASSPVFAGVVAKLNEARLGAGKAAIGFTNPFLYQNPSAFNDVTLGENKGEGPV